MTKFIIGPEEIKNGQRGCGVNCMTALACRKVLGNRFDMVGVDYLWVFTEEGVSTSFPLPSFVQDKIADFDGGIIPVEPFEFEIDLSTIGL